MGIAGKERKLNSRLRSLNASIYSTGKRWFSNEDPCTNKTAYLDTKKTREEHSCEGIHETVLVRSMKLYDNLLYALVPKNGDGIRSEAFMYVSVYPSS